MRWLGLPKVLWLQDPAWAMPSLILMSLWGIGGAMVIYLAGLQGIPQHLYEAAEIDGANYWNRFRHVTIPMMSPVIGSRRSKVAPVEAATSRSSMRRLMSSMSDAPRSARLKG